jgi:hypothetical protein
VDLPLIATLLERVAALERVDHRARSDGCP